MVKVSEKIKTVYLVELSNKRQIPIDPEELAKVLNGIQTGSPVILKQGIFNPSFFVDIVRDEKRIMEVIENNRINEFNINQGLAKPKELQPLKDIFAEVRNKLLGMPDTKR